VQVERKLKVVVGLRQRNRRRDSARRARGNRCEVTPLFCEVDGKFRITIRIRPTPATCRT
jgi:hypothetical protein